MDQVGNRYTPLERLGSGAMGVVWRAHDELLHRDVAIKQLLLPGLDAAEVDEACRRALREARIAARLQHPNAIGVFDVVVEDGKPCLVMEYLPSRSLAAVLAERGPLPPVEAARIGGHVAAALAAAHRAGVVHRDIKPGNVLIGADGTVKITDFGISRAVGDVTVTRTGMLAGTLAYLAPELARGADPTPAADVFSLGATLYALVEGRPPFGAGDNDLGMLHRIAGGRIVPPTRTGPLTPLLTRLLANDPTARPTADQASHDLSALTGSTPPPTRAVPGTGRPTPTPPPTRALPGTDRPAAAPPPTRAFPGTERSGPTGAASTATPPPTRSSSGTEWPGPLATPPPTRAWPGPERSGPIPAATSAPSTRTHPPTSPPPASGPDRRRWLVPALAALVVVAIAVTVVITSFSGDDRKAASSPTSEAGPTAAEPSATEPDPYPTTSDAPTTEPSAEPTTTAAPTELPDTATVAAFVRDHFADLPHDPAAARENWAPENRPSEWEDDQFWDAYDEVTVKGEPEVAANGATFTAHLTLELAPEEGDPVAESYRMVVVARDGDLLVVDLARS